jgi:hypothetical protein
LNFNSRKFESLIPKFFSQISSALQSYGHQVTVIGGIPRDFFLEEKIGKDWDIELTHQTLFFSKDEWKSLGKMLSQFGRVSYLPYEIIRLEKEGYEFEFSPPRVERFEEHLKDQGHKNFEADYDFQLPFEQAIKRRDFTINAIGIRFSSQGLLLLDPCEGLRHLIEKKLHPVGPDFALDPVRFLRAFRFARKLGFSFSQELENILKVMPVKGYSHAYLWSEMQKSCAPADYLSDLLQWKPIRPDLELPEIDLSKERISQLKKILSDPSHHESWMIALEWIGESSANWQKYFSLSSETSRRIARWAQQGQLFQTIHPEFFQTEFDEIKDKEDFEILFDWYFTTKQLLQKHPKLPLLSMIEKYLPAWIHLYRFEVVKDVKHIDPPLRAKYQVWNLCQRL